MASLVNGSVELKWQTPFLAKDNVPVYSYVNYRFGQNEDLLKTENPENIISIQFGGACFFVDKKAAKRTTYRYIITAIDRLKTRVNIAPPY